MWLPRITPGLLIGVCLLFPASLVLCLSLIPPSLINPFLAATFLPASIAMMLADVSVLAIRWNQVRILFSAIVIAPAAMIASSLRTVVLLQPNICSSGVEGTGFPLPWSFRFLPYTGPRGPLRPFCPLGPGFLPDGGLAFFILDMAFYAALVLGSVELYMSIRPQLRTRLKTALPKPSTPTGTEPFQPK